jgi:hypothetical protein
MQRPPTLVTYARLKTDQADRDKQRADQGRSRQPSTIFRTSLFFPHQQMQEPMSAPESDVHQIQPAWGSTFTEPLKVIRVMLHWAPEASWSSTFTEPLKPIWRCRAHTPACGIPWQLAFHQHAPQYACHHTENYSIHGMAEKTLINRNPFTPATHEMTRHPENSDALPPHCTSFTRLFPGMPHKLMPP